MQMLDCSGGVNQGCFGGSIVFLFLWLVENNITVLKEESYPTVYKDQMCTLYKYVNQIKRKVKIIQNSNRQLYICL